MTGFASQAHAKKKHHKAVKKAEVSEPAPAPTPEPVPVPEPETKHKVKVSDFPEKGWHKGPYLAATVGLVQVSNDKHIITDRQFGSWENLGFGLAFGWDIADWIGPLFQVTYSTKSAQVGDPNGGNNGGVAYPSQPAYTFPVGTFPVETARQHMVDISLFAKATLPYFTHAQWQPKMVKILPYLKLGGTGSGVYVNASTAADKSGAFGGGPAVGAGCEFVIWKGIFVALDFTEHLIFQQSISKSISTANAGSVSFKLTEGGFKPHFSLNGMFGWHF